MSTITSSTRDYSQDMRVTARMLGSLLLGGFAVLGSVVVFRQGFLPLIDAAFQPGPEWLSGIRRAGILLSASAGYWAYVHWHEKRQVTELRLRPLPTLLGGAGGAGLAALPIRLAAPRECRARCGVPLSGIEDWRALAPLESRYSGPDWLTGGIFGPESSLLVIALVAVAVVLLLRTARQRQAKARSTSF